MIADESSDRGNTSIMKYDKIKDRSFENLMHFVSFIEKTQDEARN